jgi:hypothetical protein
MHPITDRLSRNLSSTAVGALILFAICLFYSPPVGAEDRVSVAENGVYTIGAPPITTEVVAREMFQPLTEYLSQALGKKVIYRHAATWASYRSEMIRKKYDLLLEQSSLDGYCRDTLDHSLLVQTSAHPQYLLFAQKQNKDLKPEQDLAGIKICLMRAEQGVMLSWLRRNQASANPTIPLLQTDAEAVYHQVRRGTCAAGLIPFSDLSRFDPKQNETRVVSLVKDLPTYSLTAGSRVSGDDQEKIARAMINPSASAALTRMRETFALSQQFVRITEEGNPPGTTFAWEHTITESPKH